MQQNEMLLDVLIFFCLDLGCQHRRGEAFLSCGTLDCYVRDDDDSCVTQCPICNGSWSDFFLPVFKQSLIDFFSGEIVNHAFPLIVTKDSLTDLLWNSPEWILKIYNKQKGSLNRYNIEAMMLQLLANEIVEICIIDGTEKYKFKRQLITDDAGELTPQPCYKNDNYWIGIRLLGDTTKRNMGNKKK